MEVFVQAIGLEREIGAGDEMCDLLHSLSADYSVKGTEFFLYI